MIDRIADAKASQRGARNADAHQLVDVFIGKRIQHNPVQHAVDGCGGHDPQGERCDGQRGEPRRSRQTPQRKPDIAAKLLDPIQHDGFDKHFERLDVSRRPVRVMVNGLLVGALRAHRPPKGGHYRGHAPKQFEKASVVSGFSRTSPANPA
jgi:hypothetical protein